MFQQLLTKGTRVAIAAILALAVPLGIQAQQGQVTGTTIEEGTGEVLSAVQISIQGTQLGITSDADGQFTIVNVPEGTHTVRAQRLGYREVTQTVTVTAGESTTVDFTMARAALQLEGVVVTGLVDPTEGVRSPITVGRVDRTMMPVPVAGSAVQNLQGRLAGVSIARRSGQPGEDVQIQLRSQTSLTTAGRSVDPLIVVDGVILGSGTTNLESMDIESIEVVKGAAAASLYGSRANAGVIQITTNRGAGLDLDQTQFSARTELGFSTRIGDPNAPTHHPFLVDNPDNPTTYVDLDGNPVGRNDRVMPNAFQAFMVNPYPGPTYNNFRNVFQPAGFQSNNFMIQQNSTSTNFAVTLNRFVERGPLPNNDGFSRNSFRINLDHRFLDNMSLSVSGYHSRDHRDNTSGLSFSNLFRVQPDINLTAKDEQGEFLRQPDPDVALENPLWVMGSRESERNRVRTLGSANVRWELRSWASLMGNVSYDRQDSKSRLYIPKGTPTGFDGGEEDGEISFDNRIDDTWNAEVQLQVRRDLGPLNVRVTTRASLERYNREDMGASGQDFFVEGVPRIANTPAGSRNSSSYQEEIRAQGYLMDTALNYDDRYIASILVRRDGSSLFGRDNQWHNYYRTAFAWRMAQEDWFNVSNVDEFKVSYSRGTAGSRPGFSHQYELWNAGATGVSKTTLGNRDLRPEHSLEQEVSLESILYGRFGLQLSHSWQETSDQLVLLELPSFTGYANQWTNGGSLTGHTTEVTLEAEMYTSARMTWRSMMVGDRTRGKISEWPFPCTSPSWRQRCAGVSTNDIWGFVFATDVSQLTDPIQWHPATGRPNTCHDDCAAASRANEFQVNDEGMLVWVGEFDYTDGIAHDLWGTSTQIGDQVYQWGMPFNLRDPAGGAVRTRMGNASHVNLGLLNDISFGALSIHTHLHAKIGGDGINREMQLATGSNMAPEQDQSRKPEGLRKPMAYYSVVQSGASGSTYWMEDTSFLKLRTVSINYRLPDTQIQRFGLSNLGLQSMEIGLVGRDLLTFTGYRGWDPEHAMNPLGETQVDAASYPPTRSFTAEVSVTF